MKEVWKDIPNHVGYYKASNLGRIKSLKRKRVKKDLILKPKSGYNGYIFVTLCCKGVKTKYTVHTLIAICFLNHKPNGFKSVIDHIDENKINNNVNNLRIISHRNNVSRGMDRGVSKYVGVFFDKNAGKYRSCIRYSGIRKYLGTFNSEDEAHKAYLKELNKLDEYK